MHVYGFNAIKSSFHIVLEKLSNQLQECFVEVLPGERRGSRIVGEGGFDLHDRSVEVCIDHIHAFSFSELGGFLLFRKKDLNIRSHGIVRATAQQISEGHRRGRRLCKDPPAGKERSERIKILFELDCFALQIFAVVVFCDAEVMAEARCL